MKISLSLAACLLLAACAPFSQPQRGGSASTTLAGLPAAPRAPGTLATLTQPDNPAAAASQTVKRQETRQEAAPLPSVRITETPTPAGLVRVTEQFTPGPILTQTVTEETGTSIGAAQKDGSREIAATLAGSNGIRFAGVGFLVFALACFHPVVRAVAGGGKTIPALAAVAGVICIFGPAVFAGRETLVLILTAGGLAVAFLIVRLSHKEGQADALKSSPPPAG